MKKLVFASAVVATVAASAQVQAAAETFCTAGTAAYGSTVTQSAQSGTFIKQNLSNVKCSANVHLVGNDAASYYSVGSAASKGKNTFSGSSNGGGVKAAGACATAGACTASEANTAAANAS
jgi:hypothetical protein